MRFAANRSRPHVESEPHNPTDNPMQPRTRLLLLFALAGALSAGALVGGIFTGRGGSATRATSAPDATASATEAAVGGYGSTGSDELASLEQRVSRSPHDVHALTLLAYGYLQRWRDSADGSYLPRAAAALERARKLAPNDPLVVTGQGSLALTRHQFRSALRLGRQARRLAPFSARPLGVVGDALLELGRYDAAFAAFERMNALDPNVASYARIAYARELLGDVRGARAAMRLAVDASAGAREPEAWTLVEVAKLELARGRADVARRDLRAALTLMPGYVPAEEQLARVEAARGDLRQALELASRAEEAAPLPQVVMLHGDLLARLGRTSQAAEEYRTVAVIDRLLTAGGVRTDLEVALFDADHLVRPKSLAARARSARAARPSIYGDDALGWALARTGRCGEALPWLRRSLRLGTQDALLFFHRGYAEGCAGHRADMRSWYRKALATNQSFSVRWAPVAEAALR